MTILTEAPHTAAKAELEMHDNVSLGLRVELHAGGATQVRLKLVLQSAVWATDSGSDTQVCMDVGWLCQCAPLLMLTNTNNASHTTSNASTTSSFAQCGS